MPLKLVKIVNVPYYTVEGGAYEILKLWLKYVDNNVYPFIKAGVHRNCYFCGEIFSEHKDDCIYKLTEEYLHPEEYE